MSDKNHIKPFSLSPCVALLILGSVFTAHGEKFYLVKKNDTLDQIAKAHNTTTRALAKFNDLHHPDHLLAGQRLYIPPKKRITARHTVHRGEVLGTIAREYKVSVDELAAFNNLKDPNKLREGDILLIPQSRHVHEHRDSLSRVLLENLNAIPINSKKWKYVVIHHSGATQGNAQNIDRYHREERRMENGLAYHFVIGNGHGAGNGKIEIGNRWRRQISGGHLASESLNAKSIGICLVGNFENTRPTSQQMHSLNMLIDYLLNNCLLSQSMVKTHRQINTKPTKCPGRYFPRQDVIAHHTY